MKIMATTPVKINQNPNNKNSKPSFGVTRKTDYLNEHEERKALNWLLEKLKDFSPTEVSIPGAKQFKSPTGDTLIWYDKTLKPLEQLVLSGKDGRKLETTFTKSMSDIANEIKKGLGIDTKA